MSAPSLSPDQKERARKSFVILMHRLASVGNAPVALAVGCDEATISRMKSEKFEQLAQILAVLDLKIVPTGMRCFDPKDIDTLLHQAKRWMEHVGSSDQLEFED